MDEINEADRVRVRSAKSRIAAAESEVADARHNLEDVLLEIHEEGLSYRQLGELVGVTKQYAGDLVNAAKRRRAGVEEDAA